MYPSNQHAIFAFTYHYYYYFVQRKCVMRFFTSSFSGFDPTRPLIDRVKYFQIRNRFRRDIQIFNKLRSVYPTAESDSVVYIIPRSQKFRTLRLNISAKWKRNSKILKPVYERPGWVRIMKKIEMLKIS